MSTPHRHVDLHPRDLYTVPASSGWFNWDSIHDTERRSIPEFFDNSSYSRNPRVYKEYRDFIINKFRECPTRRLTFTEVRKSLVGDVGSVEKVFRWLDRWGLINFGVERGRDGGGGSKGVVVVVEEGAPVGVKVVAAGGGGGGGGGESVGRVGGLSSYSDVFGDFWVAGKGPVCAGCGDQCEAGRFETVKGGYALCLKCLENKNKKEANTAIDSNSNNHVDGSGNHVKTVWTDAETLLLLEAAIKHGDDWDLIAQHVRSKSKLDCIARLINLPFSEHASIRNKLASKNSVNDVIKIKAVENVVEEQLEETSKTNGEQQTDTDEKKNVAEDSTLPRPTKRRCLPSLDSTEPLMNQVALLSTVAGPHIAAAAAEASVKALCRENPCAQKAFEIGEVESGDISGLAIKNELESDLKFEDQNAERDTQPEFAPGKSFGATTFRIRAAIATSLGAVAARAKLLASQEENEMELLMASIIETQLKKIKIKMKHLEEVERIMEKEYSQIQQLKESIVEEWTSMLQHAIHSGIPRWRDSRFPKLLLNTYLK